MSELIGRVASTLADARGRRTLTVLELDLIPPADREAAMTAVLAGNASDSLLARWDRKWLKGTIRGGLVAMVTLSAGGVVVASEGNALGVMVMIGFSAAVLSIRGLSDHLDLPARIAWPAELAQATVLSVTITPRDRLAHELWARGHELWTRASQPNAVPRTEFNLVRELAYRAQAEVARLVAADRRRAAGELDARTRTACDALRRLEAAVARAEGRAWWPGAGVVEIGTVPEPDGVLSEVDAAASSDPAAPVRPEDRYWQPYPQPNRPGRG
ncbi:MAG: hypothetical protein QM804_16635 [Propionicimonas sp.]